MTTSMMRERRNDNAGYGTGHKKLDRCAEWRWVPTTDLGQSCMGIGNGHSGTDASQMDQARMGRAVGTVVAPMQATKISWRPESH
jgi:hypothetical protein